jgi:isovaleryl-CoA dehydrogenase
MSEILSEEHRMLSDTVYQFALKEIWPIADKIDREDRFPDDMFMQLGELGVLGITIPEEYGGSAFDLLAGVIVSEQLSRICPAVGISYSAHANLCMHNLYRNGTEDQRAKYLPKLSSGEHVGALALTEPNAGSDAVGIQTRARKNGEKYFLSGRKIFITNGPIADTLLVYAKTDMAKGSKGISAFIVEKEFVGYSVSRELEKLGNRGSPTGELLFEDCEVPQENLLGKENAGSAVMMSGLDIERAFVSGLPLGIAQGAFDLALRYAKEREQFGQIIANFQLIQAKLADMYTLIEAARSLVYKTARMADQGKKISKEAAAAYLFTSETATKVALDAIQIHGGYGYILEYPVNRYLRDAKLYEIGGGTSEIRRLVIARELLK